MDGFCKHHGSGQLGAATTVPSPLFLSVMGVGENKRRPDATTRNAKHLAWTPSLLLHVSPGAPNPAILMQHGTGAPSILRHCPHYLALYHRRRGAAQHSGSLAQCTRGELLTSKRVLHSILPPSPCKCSTTHSATLTPRLQHTQLLHHIA